MMENERTKIWIADCTCNKEYRDIFLDALRHHGIPYEMDQFEKWLYLHANPHKKLSGTNEKWICLWDQSPFSYAAMNFFKPGKNDIFIALKKKGWYSQDFEEKFPAEVSHRFLPDAVKEIEEGKPHVFMIDLDTYEGMWDLEYALYGDHKRTAEEMAPLYQYLKEEAEAKERKKLPRENANRKESIQFPPSHTESSNDHQISDDEIMIWAMLSCIDFVKNSMAWPAENEIQLDDNCVVCLRIVEKQIKGEDRWFFEVVAYKGKDSNNEISMSPIDGNKDEIRSFLQTQAADECQLIRSYISSLRTKIKEKDDDEFPGGDW